MSPECRPFSVLDTSPFPVQEISNLVQFFCDSCVDVV